MDALDAIFNRRSVRSFLDKPIEEAKLRLILAAAMSGPSCVNARDWSFIVVTAREQLKKMADANGPYAAPLKSAACGILVCGDLERAFEQARDYWIIDGAIAAQNIILCAEALGLGSVWLGTWPQMERVKKQAELFRLPTTVVPHSVLALGYPAESERKLRVSRYEEGRVHRNEW